jgi:DNA polymerase-4
VIREIGRTGPAEVQAQAQAQAQAHAQQQEHEHRQEPAPVSSPDQGIGLGLGMSLGLGPWARVIVHADLDAFFAAAEILRRPELRGKPVIVGGQPGGRGVVAAASYEARAVGVRSAMPVGRAVRLCPHAVFLSPDFSYYRTLSDQFQDILGRFSPLVEMISIDEAYLDLSGAGRHFRSPLEAARQIKRCVSDELRLVVSLGVASSRMVAKIASDLDKPDGLRVVERGAEARFLAPLSVERMPGIGPRATERLHRLGVTTLGGLADLPLTLIEPIFGRRSQEMLARARGVDDRPVQPDHGPARSVGHERTFRYDLRDPGAINLALADLAERTARDLRRKGLRAGSVAVKLRYGDFETVGRQQRLDQPTDVSQPIADLSVRLAGSLLARRRAPVRLLGVRVATLRGDAVQLPLFETDDVDDGAEPTGDRRLDAVLSRLADDLGPGVVRLGRARPQRRAG